MFLFWAERLDGWSGNTRLEDQSDPTKVGDDRGNLFNGCTKTDQHGPQTPPLNGTLFESCSHQKSPITSGSIEERN